MIPNNNKRKHGMICLDEEDSNKKSNTENVDPTCPIVTQPQPPPPPTLTTLLSPKQQQQLNLTNAALHERITNIKNEVINISNTQLSPFPQNLKPEPLSSAIIKLSPQSSTSNVISTRIPPSIVGITCSLHQCVANSGFSFTTGPCPELSALPGLYCEDYGLVSLPLDVSTGTKLVAFSKPAVNSYKIEAAKVGIVNKEWKVGVEKLVERVAKELGCQGKVEARLNRFENIGIKC